MVALSFPSMSEDKGTLVSLPANLWSLDYYKSTSRISPRSLHPGTLNHRPFRLHTLSTAFFHSSRRNFGHDDQSKIRKEFLLLYQFRFQHLLRSSFLSENHVGHICGHKCNQIAVLSKHPDAHGLRTNADSSTESRACAAPCTYTLVSVADLIISDGLIEVFSQSGNCGNRKGGSFY